MSHITSYERTFYITMKIIASQSQAYIVSDHKFTSQIARVRGSKPVLFILFLWSLHYPKYRVVIKCNELNVPDYQMEC